MYFIACEGNTIIARPDSVSEVLKKRRFCTQRKLDIEFSKDKRLFPSYVTKGKRVKRKKKERKKRFSSFRYSMRNCSNRTKNIPRQGRHSNYPRSAKEKQRDGEGNRSTYRRQKITRAEITGATPRADIFPFINIHCVRFRTPAFIRLRNTRTTYTNQTFDDSCSENSSEIRAKR